MADKSETAMAHGVRNSKIFLAILTGPCPNPRNPDDDPIENAYFSRPFCVKELEWAIEARVPIQPIVCAEDKSNIGKLMSLAPEHLKFLGGVGKPWRSLPRASSLERL